MTAPCRCRAAAITRPRAATGRSSSAALRADVSSRVAVVPRRRLPCASFQLRAGHQRRPLGRGAEPRPSVPVIQDAFCALGSAARDRAPESSPRRPASSSRSSATRLRGGAGWSTRYERMNAARSSSARALQASVPSIVLPCPYHPWESGPYQAECGSAPGKWTNERTPSNRHGDRGHGVCRLWRQQRPG